MRFYLSTAETPLGKKIYDEKIVPAGKKDHFIKVEDGMDKVRKGLHAFLAEDTKSYYVIEKTYFEHEKCELVNIEHLRISDPYLVIKKRSPLKEILKVK